MSNCMGADVWVDIWGWYPSSEENSYRSVFSNLITSSFWRKSGLLRRRGPEFIIHQFFLLLHVYACVVSMCAHVYTHMLMCVLCLSTCARPEADLGMFLQCSSTLFFEEAFLSWPQGLVMWILLLANFLRESPSVPSLARISGSDLVNPALLQVLGTGTLVFLFV